MPPRDTKLSETRGLARRVATTCAALAAVWLVGACAAIEELTKAMEIPDSVAAVPLGSPPPRSEPPRDANARLGPAVNDDPEQVIGLDDTAIETLLGQPSFRREDSPAQVWQYDNDECILDVFLYTDGPTAPHRALYYEMRAKPDGELVGGVGTRRCFRSLLQTPNSG